MTVVEFRGLRRRGFARRTFPKSCSLHRSIYSTPLKERPSQLPSMYNALAAYEPNFQRPRCHPNRWKPRPTESSSFLSKPSKSKRAMTCNSFLDIAKFRSNKLQVVWDAGRDLWPESLLLPSWVEALRMVGQMTLRVSKKHSPSPSPCRRIADLDPWEAQAPSCRPLRYLYNLARRPSLEPNMEPLTQPGTTFSCSMSEA